MYLNHVSRFVSIMVEHDFWNSISETAIHNAILLFFLNCLKKCLYKDFFLSIFQALYENN